MVGIGPGNSRLLTQAARESIAAADLVVGYETYLRQIPSLLEGKETMAYPMTAEVERARTAIIAAKAGRQVVVISGGDPGIYGMAGPVLEIAATMGMPVVVEPGITAATAAASLLGAPLMQDVAIISLSDRLTPWDKIRKRIGLAAEADLVLVFYNPASHGRITQIGEARTILTAILPGETPVGIVRNAFREGETVVITNLEQFIEYTIDMSSVVIVGNRQTKVINGRMITPRGYTL